MIVVAGSINLDLVAYVDRLPRGGETLAGRTFSASAGGKGANQALAARRAGAAVALVGAVGDDAFAAPALALLRRDGVDLCDVRVVPDPTGVALIHVDATGENAITVVAGANATLVADDVPAARLRAGDTLVMPLEIPHATVAALALRARSAQMRVVLNAAPAAPVPAATLACVDVLVVNEIEARTLAQAHGMPDAPAAFCRAAAERFGGAVVVTLGAHGACAAHRGESLALPAPAVDVVDTVGAGDALIGALAAALDRGASLSDALREGLAAGSLACTRAGAQPSLPWRDEIVALAATI